MTRDQQVTRDRQGRYSFEGKWERLCTCGHTLGNHTAVAPHECIAGDFDESARACDCSRFRPSRKTVKARKGPAHMPNRADYLALFLRTSDAIEFENSALSVGDEFLPPFARDVRDKRTDDPSAAYWTWLIEQAQQAQNTAR